MSINWDGQEASTAAPKIDDLLNVMIVISSFVFSLVMVMLFYALWKFKAKPGDESDGEPIHGNTPAGGGPGRQRGFLTLPLARESGPTRKRIAFPGPFAGVSVMQAGGQAGLGSQRRSFAMSAFARRRSFRMTATIATLAGFPAATRRS